MSVHSATGCCGEMVEQVGDATIRWVARKEIGATELTVGVTRMKAGGMNPAHRHPNCEEVLHVLEGEVEHYCEGEPLVRLHAGHTAIVPRNRRHRARNVGATEAQWVVSFSSAERQTIFVRDEPDAHLQELSKLFNVPRVDKISWGHAVNSQAFTAECIANGTQFFEADIIARASDSVPVMGHPPATDSDITFDEWAHKVAAARRGLKLDMKHASVLSPVMATLTRMVHEKKLPPEVPVWLNADVVEIASAPHITAADLVAAATAFQKIHPNMALSTGFTLSRTSVYTHAKREELEHAVGSFTGHVTVPLHAGLVCRDWTAVRPFLDRTNFSITLWGQITKEQLEFLEKNVIGPKVFPDVQLQP